MLAPLLKETAVLLNKEDHMEFIIKNTTVDQMSAILTMLQTDYDDVGVDVNKDTMLVDRVTITLNSD